MSDITKAEAVVRLDVTLTALETARHSLRLLAGDVVTKANHTEPGSDERGRWRAVDEILHGDYDELLAIDASVSALRKMLAMPWPSDDEVTS